MVSRSDEPQFKRNVEIWTKITGNECGRNFLVALSTPCAFNKMAAHFLSNKHKSKIGKHLR